MKVLIVLGVFLVTIVVVCVSHPLLDIAEGRIVGGQLANSTQFPYQVALRIKYNETSTRNLCCGGSLIHPEWVLTAAHCLDGTSNGTVFLGSTNWRNSTQTIKFVNREVYIHPEYNGQNENDIALIKLPINAILNEYVQTVKLPNLLLSYIDYDVVVAGWGKTGDNSSTVNDLRYIVSKVDSNDVCQSAYKNEDYTPAKHLCMVNTVSMNTCSGDSGSPMVLLDEENTQIGLLIAGGHYGCQSGEPSIFLRLTSYLSWIRFITGVVAPYGIV